MTRDTQRPLEREAMWLMMALGLALGFLWLNVRLIINKQANMTIKAKRQRVNIMRYSAGYQMVRDCTEVVSMVIKGRLDRGKEANEYYREQQALLKKYGLRGEFEDGTMIY